MRPRATSPVGARRRAALAANFSCQLPIFALQRAVETPPHPGASSNGFYAPPKRPAGRASPGAMVCQRRASLYADLRTCRRVLRGVYQPPGAARAMVMQSYGPGQGQEKGNLGNLTSKATLTH